MKIIALVVVVVVVVIVVVVVVSLNRNVPIYYIRFISLLVSK